MRKMLSLALLALLVVCSTVAASAEAPADIKLARVLSYQKKYDESLAYYNRYIARNPKAYPIILEAADVTFWKGDTKTATDLYLKAAADKKLAPKAYYQAGFMEMIGGDLTSAAEHLKASLDLQPDNIEVRMKLAQVLSYDKRYRSSVEQYDIILVKDPSNLDALSQKADVLSWEQNYKASIAAYDERLKLQFDPTVARQKARVLGWWKKYDRSLKAYEAAYDESGDRNIEMEMDGKRAYWNKWVRTAIKRYHLLLDNEPKNVEARFDLAQTEAYQRQWGLARSDFQLIVDQGIGHFRSSDSLTKLKEQTRPYLIPEVRYFRARSGEFDTHVNHFQAGLTLGESFSENLDISAGYTFDTYLFENFSRILRNRGKLAIGAYLPMDLLFNAAYIPIQYEGISRFSNNFESSLSSRPFDPVFATVFFNRNDLDVNHTVFADKTYTTDIGGRIQADINRRWTLYADGAYSWLNDKNRKKALGIENLVFLSYEPKRLSADLRFDYYGYNFVTPNYWSPGNFWNASGTIHWRHYLNPNGLYYGAKDTYYGFKYRFQVDKNNNIYNGGTAEFYHDFSLKTAISMEVNGLYSSVYDDLGAFLKIVQRF